MNERRGQSERNFEIERKEKKGYLFILFIFDHFWLHFAAFVTAHVIFMVSYI